MQTRYLTELTEQFTDWTFKWMILKWTINRKSGAGKVLSVFNVQQYFCVSKEIGGKIIGNNCRPGQLDSTSNYFTWISSKV